MKRIIPLLLIVLILSACGAPVAEITPALEVTAAAEKPTVASTPTLTDGRKPEYISGTKVLRGRRKAPMNCVSTTSALLLLSAGGRCKTISQKDTTIRILNRTCHSIFPRGRILRQHVQCRSRAQKQISSARACLEV